MRYLIFSLLLCSCSYYFPAGESRPQVGETRDQIQKRLGEPDLLWRLDSEKTSGEHWEYWYSDGLARAREYGVVSVFFKDGCAVSITEKRRRWQVIGRP